jgi:hypothetical protein
LILLIVCRNFSGLAPCIDRSDDISKIGRAIQVDLSDRVLISFEYTVDTIAFWREDVTVECETVGG